MVEWRHYSLLFLTLSCAVTANDIRKCCGKDEVIDTTSQMCLKWDAVGNGRQQLEDFFINASLKNYGNDEDIFDFNLTGALPCDLATHDNIFSINSDTDNVTTFSTAFNMSIPNIDPTTVVLRTMPQIDIPSPDFCIDRAFRATGQGHYDFEGTASKLCKKKLTECNAKTCIRQCCYANQVSSGSNELVDCKLPADENATLFDGMKISKSSHEKNENLHILYGHPNWKKVENCKQLEIVHRSYEKDTCETYNENLLVIDEEGYFEFNCRKYSYNEYCIRHTENLDKNGSVIGYHANILLCSDVKKTLQYKLWQIKSTVMPILHIVSSIFVAALVGYEIWIKNTSTLAGALRFCTIVHLLIFNVLHVIFILRDPNKPSSASIETLDGLCFAFGFLQQFFHISTMCWMTAMSIQLWAKFRMVRVPNFNKANIGTFDGFKDKKFKWFGLMSWGIPSMVTLVTAVMQFLPKEITCGYVVPGMGKNQCFLNRKGYSIFLYLHIIIVPILMGNTFMFCVFTYNLNWGTWASNKTNDLIRTSQKKRYVMVLKMFFVLGVTFSLEIIENLLRLKYDYCTEELAILEAISNFVNASGGFWMFFAITVNGKRIKWSLTSIRNMFSRITQAKGQDFKDPTQRQSCATTTNPT